VDRHRFDADPDPDPYQTFQFDAEHDSDPDLTPSLNILANLKTNFASLHWSASLHFFYVTRQHQSCHNFLMFQYMY
jgi:hypothetical protein